MRTLDRVRRYLRGPGGWLRHGQSTRGVAVPGLVRSGATADSQRPQTASQSSIAGRSHGASFFVKNDTELKVFAHWGDFVGEDLRHEVTHGYLHAVVPEIPLWLDEGLAEYFEVPRGRNGFHRDHIFFLTQQARSDEWRPNLQRLEALTDAAGLTQADYAESWLWVHYMLETRPELRKLLQDQLARLRMTGETRALSEYLSELADDPASELVGHLAELGKQLKDEL